MLKIVYVLFLDGQQALKTSKVYFNQKASCLYRGISAADKEKLNKDTEELIVMTPLEATKRCQIIFNRMNTLVILDSCYFYSMTLYWNIHTVY